MAWFKVDDGLPDHRKTRKVRRSHPTKGRDVAPFGLWVLAGAWASGNGTGGFIPTEELEDWDDDAVELADRLVGAGLWWETHQGGEDGYGFHDWQDYVARPETVEDASESGRRGNHVRWHVRREQHDPDCEFCTLENGGESGGDDRPDRVPEPDAYREPGPTRPDPTQQPCASADAERGSDPDQRTIEDDFDDWYERYPRKRGKGQALKAYRAARKKTNHQTLVDAIEQQRDRLTERGTEFVPYPATWLNGERWTDELEAEQATNVRRLPQPSPPEATEQPPSGLTDEEWLAWDTDRRARLEARLRGQQ